MYNYTKKLVLLFLVLLICSGYSISQDKPKGEIMENEKVTKRVGSLIQLRPEYEERYIILHKYTFPGVLDRIQKSNIRNYSIFLLDGILFSHYEYVGNDFEADMEAIADPVTKDWWKLTDPMQEPLPGRKDGEWWATMEQLFCLDKIIQPSSTAQRIALEAEIQPGSEDKVRELFSTFPDELKELTNKEHFQNNNIYMLNNKLYFYYEYIGTDIRNSFSHLNRSELFRSFQNELNSYLLPKENSSWQLMKEVFHTD